MLDLLTAGGFIVAQAHARPVGRDPAAALIWQAHRLALALALAGAAGDGAAPSLLHARGAVTARPITKGHTAVNY